MTYHSPNLRITPEGVLHEFGDGHEGEMRNRTVWQIPANSRGPELDACELHCRPYIPATSGLPSGVCPDNDEVGVPKWARTKPPAGGA